MLMRKFIKMVDLQTENINTIVKKGPDGNHSVLRRLHNQCVDFEPGIVER